MSERIPENWKQAVLAILDGRDPDHIDVTQRAVLEFQSLFPGAFMFEIYQAFMDALMDPQLEGKREYGLFPECEAYAFIFIHKRRELYGKVGLTTDGELVIIFSAHIPMKGNLL